MRVFLCILLSGLLINCKTAEVSNAKKVLTTENLQLNLLNIYYQEIVPGQENQETLFNINFKLNDTEIQVDSLIYNAQTIIINKMKTDYLCNLKESLSNKEFTIYYKKNKLNYYSKHQIIKILEPIYQP